MYVNGCPCHVLDNTASKASEKFTEVVSFEVEDFLVDIYYWFDKKTKRHVQLERFCNYCDKDLKKIFENVCTRWLSLEYCVTRILRLFQALRSCFLSEENPSPRFQTLASKFTNPMTWFISFFVKMYFNHLSISIYFLQREDPLISRLHLQIHHFPQRLGCKFLKLDIMADKAP